MQVVAQSFPDLPAPRRVLVLHSDNRLLLANLLFDESLRGSFTADSGGPVECWGEFLDEVRFPRRDSEWMRELLRDKYGEDRPEVIVAFGSPSLEFLLRNNQSLFPEVPIVFAGLSAVPPSGQRPPARLTGVRSSSDGPATLRLGLRLHPRTRQVFVITNAAGRGDSADGEWGRLQSVFPGSMHRLSGESFPRLLEELAGLPQNSLVLDLSGGRSSTDPLGGQAGSPEAAMARMSQVATAPIYGVLDPLVGHGLVGAVATPIDVTGRAAASLVRDVLSREPGRPLGSVRTLEPATLVDWRQMRRWGLRKSHLPRGTLVRFEPPSFWRQYRLLVITSGGLFLLQTGLIVALVLQSRRRRRAEIEARRRREELAHTTRVAALGELTASLAHEINQPLTAILSNSQAALRLLDQGDAPTGEIREILSDIAADDRRAGEVIRRMRTLLRKGESAPTELDVNDLVDDVAGLVRGEMILQNVALALEVSSRPLRVHGDRVQLQQVLLNLMMNALDALREDSAGSRRVVVRTAAAGPRSIEVSVQDNGTGIPAQKLEEIFQPFVTTKPAGIGLGLAICRSIIQAHGGRLGARNNTDRGATFWFTLPATEDAKR